MTRRPNFPVMLGWLRFLGLLAVIAVLCRLATERTTPQPLSLSFRVAPRYDFKDASSLTLQGRYLSCGGRVRSLAKVDMAEVERLLDEGGFWRMPLTDGTNWGGEGNIVYTALEVSDGARSRRLLWRGLGWRQVALADRLLHGPFGPEAIEVVNAAAAYKYKQQYGSDNVGESAMLLRNIQASQVLPMLQYLFPDTRFRLDPARNGFYYVPSPRERDLKYDIRNIDRDDFLQHPEPPS